MLLGKVLSIVAASAALLDGSMKAALPDKNMEGTMFLINRQHAVSEFFVPETLRKVEATGMSQSMRDDAATALEEMFAAAKEEGVTLSTVSGYRSYSKQSTIYARKKASQGEEEADRVSARPGTSEHQLGLAMDISKKNSSQLNTSFAETEEGRQRAPLRLYRALPQGIRGRDGLYVRALARSLCGQRAGPGHL